MTAAVDLFCGAGGASLGLHRAGYDVLGLDYWQPAIDTHNANGLPARRHDLSDPKFDEQVPYAPLWWASPPCQPFSAAGDGEGEFDGRDGFPWLLRLVALRLPDVLIVENVKGLTFEKHRGYFGGVLDSLRGLGYDVAWRVLNSADYGVPQTRERCFIVARRDGGPICWPAVTHTETEGLFTRPWVTMTEALGWGMSERPAFTIPAREADGGPRMDGVGGSGARAAMYAERDAGRWVLNTGRGWVKGGNRDDAQMVELNQPAPTVSGVGGQFQRRWISGVLALDICGDHAEHVCDCPACCAALGWPHHRLATTIAGDTPVFQPGGHHQPGEHPIRLTIPELATLQGFPPDWEWTGTKTAQARQVGNAVPPVMAELLATVNRPLLP